MFLAEASIQLVPDGSLLLHLVVIFLMVFILNHTLLKPINRILAEREKQIGGRLSEAQMLSADAEEKSRQQPRECEGSQRTDRDSEHRQAHALPHDVNHDARAW